MLSISAISSPDDLRFRSDTSRYPGRGAKSRRFRFFGGGAKFPRSPPGRGFQPAKAIQCPQRRLWAPQPGFPIWPVAGDRPRPNSTMVTPDCITEKANLSVFRRWQRFGQRPNGLRIAPIDLQALVSPGDARTARAPATVGTTLKRRVASHTHPAIGPARALAAHWCSISPPDAGRQGRHQQRTFVIDFAFRSGRRPAQTGSRAGPSGSRSWREPCTRRVGGTIGLAAIMLRMVHSSLFRFISQTQTRTASHSAFARACGPACRPGRTRRHRRSR